MTSLDQMGAIMRKVMCVVLHIASKVVFFLYILTFTWLISTLKHNSHMEQLLGWKVTDFYLWRDFFSAMAVDYQQDDHLTDCWVKSDHSYDDMLKTSIMTVIDALKTWEDTSLVCRWLQETSAETGHLRWRRKTWGWDKRRRCRLFGSKKQNWDVSSKSRRSGNDEMNG